MYRFILKGFLKYIKKWLMQFKQNTDRIRVFIYTFFFDIMRLVARKFYLSFD